MEGSTEEIVARNGNRPTHLPVRFSSVCESRYIRKSIIEKRYEHMNSLVLFITAEVFEFRRSRFDSL